MSKAERTTKISDPFISKIAILLSDEIAANHVKFCKNIELKGGWKTNGLSLWLDAEKAIDLQKNSGIENERILNGNIRIIADSAGIRIIQYSDIGQVGLDIFQYEGQPFQEETSVADIWHGEHRLSLEQSSVYMTSAILALTSNK